MTDRPHTVDHNRAMQLVDRLSPETRARLAQRLDDRFHEADGAPLRGPLSPRQREVLRLVARGLTQQEIARQLVISRDTVRHHLRQIYAALEARNAPHATALAAARGLITAADITPTTKGPTR